MDIELLLIVAILVIGTIGGILMILSVYNQNKEYKKTMEDKYELRIEQVFFNDAGEVVFIEPLQGWDEEYSNDYESLLKSAEKDIERWTKNTKWGYGTYIYSIVQKDDIDGKYNNLIWRKEVIVPREEK